MSTRQPKSSWQRQGKTRIIYSASYQHWREVALEKGACHPEAVRLGCLHAKQFGYRANAADGSVLPAAC